MAKRGFFPLIFVRENPKIRKSEKNEKLKFGLRIAKKSINEKSINNLLKSQGKPKMNLLIILKYSDFYLLLKDSLNGFIYWPHVNLGLK